MTRRASSGYAVWSSSPLQNGEWSVIAVSVDSQTLSVDMFEPTHSDTQWADVAGVAECVYELPLDRIF